MDIWVHPHTVILYWCRWGWIFGKLGCGQGQVVWWFHGSGYKQLQTDSIPHPYHMHIKCLSTLICCWWTYGCTLILLLSCKWGWNFEKLGCGWEQMVLCWHGWVYKQHQKASHINIICKKSVLAPWYAVDGHMSAPSYCYTCVSGDEFLKSWHVGDSEWYCGVMVESTNSFRRHPTSISYVYKVF